VKNKSILFGTKEDKK